MIGFKIYYEIETGDVILTIPEKNNFGAVETTKEQDFIMFDVLQARNPETIDFIQLEFGQYQSDFQTARSWKVDIETEQILFEYPVFSIPLSEQVKQLQRENEALKEENKTLMLALAESVETQQQDKMENQLAVAELVETLTNKGRL